MHILMIHKFLLGMQEGRTALHIASEKGHAGVVEMLLAAGLDVNAETSVSRTAYL